MAQDTFEITIEKDLKKDGFDVNNASKEALHAFKVFVQSLDTIVSTEFSSQDVSCDLGTNKLAIKASEDNIGLLNKWINDYRENKLPKKHGAYSALHEIEQIFTNNGLTYSAVILHKDKSVNLTSVFKKAKHEAEEPAILKSEVDHRLSLGFHIITGKVGNITLKRQPFVLSFDIPSGLNHKILCSSESLRKIDNFLGTDQAIHIACKTQNNNGKIENWFFEHYSENEFREFSEFFNQVQILEGTERLKYIYRFLNNYIIEDKLNVLVKFAKPFLVEHSPINDVSSRRMVLDLLKKVSDNSLITDLYNDFILSINKSIRNNIC